MSEAVYTQTSILGYLTAQPSRDLVVVVNIEITEQGNTHRSAFQLYSSQAVVKETSQEDAESKLPSSSLSSPRGKPLSTKPKLTTSLPVSMAYRYRAENIEGKEGK